MSVIFFGAEELGNVASYLTATRHSNDEHRAEVARWLAEYSVGNAWAFERQYREMADPVSVEEIRKRINPLRFNRDSARTTLRLLAYNGITNAGQEIRLAGYFEALANIMILAYGRLADELEASSR